MAIGRKYGWVPDLPDNRDLMYKSIKPITFKLPSSINLTPFCSPVEDQGELGSCTANSLVAALEFIELKEKRDKGLQPPFSDYSRLFLYYNERALEGTTKVDAGAMIRDGIKSINTKGCCSEDSWPYDISKFAVKPPKSCYAEAIGHKSLQYARITTLDEMKTCLASGYPFVFGFMVYASFESPEVTKTGVVPMPQPFEKALGGHAVLAVGYDDLSSRFVARNSWGTKWGKKGYFTIPYKYLTNSNLADDMWNIITLEE